MAIPDSLTLKKAMKIAVKIEKLQTKLHELLGTTFELPPATSAMTSQLVELSNAPRRRGRPPGSGRKAREGDASGNSPLAGRPRPRSISGPLAPAVVKVLQRYNRPMKVTEILIGLEQDNYVWTAKNPKQTLYVRIGKLAGVRKSGAGVYVAESLSAPVGIVPEAIVPSSEPSFSSETAAF